MTTTQSLTPKLILSGLGSRAAYFTRPIAIIRSYDRSNLRPDFIAGITVGAILLPQAIAFALLAGLPPQMGLFGAIIGTIVSALWGSSNHLHGGPTNTHSLLTASVLITVAPLGSPDFIVAAGLMAVMVGIFRLIAGLARLGMLANFISDAVIVGFTAGAGILIVVGQLPNLLKITITGGENALLRIHNILLHAPEAHLLSAGLGVAVIILLLLLSKWAPKLPGPLIVMILGAAAVGLMRLDLQGVRVIGAIPSGLPPIAKLPFFDLDLIGKLSGGALAIGAIGLVEAVSISRSIAAQTAQRLDSNQEFIGQGMANIAMGIFSSYPGSASFNRSAVNYSAGARTGMAAVFSGLVLLVAMLVLGPVTAFVPFTILAGILIVIAYHMVDYKEISRIWRSTRGDATIMMATFLATLLLPLQFAVLTGILMSLAYYILKTSTPSVLTVLPTEDYRHFEHRPDLPPCPQLSVIEIRGDLYFGAVNHIEEIILENRKQNPSQQFLLLRMQNIQHLDISGVHMLESVVRSYREAGGDVFLVKVRPNVKHRMETTGFHKLLREDHFLDEDAAISHIFYHVLDPVTCIYECEVRAFLECQNLPRPALHIDLPATGNLSDDQFTWLSPYELYAELHSSAPPMVIDVREPREFNRAHIPEAQNIPLPTLLSNPPDLPRNRAIVLNCRTSRRSRRAAYTLQQLGYKNIRILDDGIVGWETANLLEAV